MSSGAPSGQGAAKAASTQQITVQCSCGKRLKAPATAVGKRAKCPGCGNVLTISAPAATPAPAKPKNEPKIGLEQDDLDGLYALAASEQAAAASAALDDSPRCPACSTSMPAGAVLCTNCGFDTRTSARVSASKARPPVANPELAAKYASKGKKDKLAPQGSLWVGVAASAGFAAVGSILWVLIAFLTHREWALVAMGVGALAGVGMQIGQKGYSTTGGIIAAAMTFFAIIAANIAYWILVIAAAVHAHKPSAQAVDVQAQLKQYDQRLVHKLVEEHHKQLKDVPEVVDKKRSSDDEDEDADVFVDRRTELAEKQTLDQLKAMPKPEYDAAVAKAEQEETRTELIGFVEQDIVKQRQISWRNNDYMAQLKQARDDATKQVDNLSPAQQSAQLKVSKAKAEQEMAAEMKQFREKMAESKDEADAEAKADATAKMASKKDDDASSSSHTGAFLIILLLIFGWKSILFVLIGMALAYRTAAGAVAG